MNPCQPKIEMSLDVKAEWLILITVSEGISDNLMASWIVHLRIAENLLKDIAKLNASTFAIGNIAPDSGIPDEKWENFNPPAEVTHFKAERGGSFEIKDMRFYRSYLAGESLERNTERYSFLLGYFFHLATDNFWHQRIGIPTKERYSKEFEADKKFIWEVKRDWYGLDFIYIRDHPSSIFWQLFVNSDIQESYLDFLPIEAIHHRMNYIKEYYQRQDDKIRELYERPYIYLTKDEMDGFVDHVSQALFGIYRHLSNEQQETTSYSSALELPEKHWK